MLVWNNAFVNEGDVDVLRELSRRPAQPRFTIMPELSDIVRFSIGEEGRANSRVTDRGFCIFVAGYDNIGRRDVGDCYLAALCELLYIRKDPKYRNTYMHRGLLRFSSSILWGLLGSKYPLPAISLCS